MSFQPSIFAFLSLALLVCNGEGNICKVKVEKVGCFNDRSRPLNTLLVYRRNEYDHEKQHIELPRLICDCAKKAALRGYSYIGLQFYAECWTSSEKRPSYDRDGPSPLKCENSHFQPCSQNDTDCVGGEYANFVYKIVYSDGNNSGTKATSATTTPASTTMKTPPSPTSTKPPCKDNLPDCLDFIAYCSHEYPAMLKQCAKTCNVCKT